MKTKYHKKRDTWGGKTPGDAMPNLEEDLPTSSLHQKSAKSAKSVDASAEIHQWEGPSDDEELSNAGPEKQQANWKKRKLVPCK